MAAHRYRVSSGGDENILKLGSDNDCKMLPKC